MREVDLFKRFNILLLDSQKEKLDTLKEKVSMIENLQMDNSALIRGMIEYFNNNEERLIEVANYASKMKGYKILKDYENMVDKNKSAKEIKDKLGIDVESKKISKNTSME